MLRVRDIMTRSVVAVEPVTPVADAVRVMAAHNIRHLLVVQGSKLIGILSINDVPQYVKPQLFVFDVMTPRPICISPHQPVEAARTLMANHTIASLPVVDNDNLVGIVTVSDIANIGR